MTEKIALDGGKPVRDEFLTYARQWTGQEEIDEVVDTLRSDWLTTGPKIEAYEKQMAEYIGCKYTLTTSACTAGLHICLLAHDIGPGDEVILPDLTFAATPAVVSMTGATPVLVDVNPETYVIDTDKIEEKITDKTKAIMPVHYGGQSCDMDKIREIAKKHNLVIIEDAAHAIGGEYNGKKVGSESTAACYSFHPIKNMTMGEGGVIALNDDELYEKLKLFRLHGLKDYKMVLLGYKYTINDMQAALGIRQLEKLDSFIKRRNEIAKKYSEAFKDMSEINLPVTQDNVLNAFHLFAITLNLDKLSVDRDKIREALRAENIHTQIHFTPIHQHPYYDNLGTDNDFPVATKIYNTMLSIPMFPKMTDQDVEDVINAIKKVIAYYRK